MGKTQFERVAYSENGEKFLMSACRGMWEMRRDKGGRVYGGNDGGGFEHDKHCSPRKHWRLCNDSKAHSSTSL